MGPEVVQYPTWVAALSAWHDAIEEGRIIKLDYYRSPANKICEDQFWEWVDKLSSEELRAFHADESDEEQ